MSKSIMILYCGGWGYGGTAWSLMDAIQSKYPGVNIDCQPDYDGPGGRIDVIISDKDKKAVKIWSGSRAQVNQDLGKILTLVGSNIKWSKLLHIRIHKKKTAMIKLS